MCLQVQSVTLQTAVLLQATEFANNNQPFSVHDITRTLRNKVAQGELEIPETEVQGASFKFEVEHQRVKELFDELWRTGVFDSAFTLTRTFKPVEKYFEYTPTLVAGPSVPTPAVAPAPTPSVTPAPMAQYSVTPSVASSALPSDITDRVKLYLTNCVGRNFRPTLKQVQSAIKRGDASTGTSCETLKSLVEGLGYTVVSDPDALSQAQVATV